MNLLDLPFDIIRKIIIFSVDSRSLVLAVYSIGILKSICQIFNMIIEKDALFWKGVYISLGLKRQKGDRIPSNLFDTLAITIEDQIPTWHDYYIYNTGDINIVSHKNGQEIYRGPGKILICEAMVLKEENKMLSRLDESTQTFVHLHIAGENPFLIHAYLLSIHNTVKGIMACFYHIDTSLKDKYFLYYILFIKGSIFFEYNSHVFDYVPSITYNGLYIRDYCGLNGFSFIAFLGGIGMSFNLKRRHFVPIDSGNPDINLVICKNVLLAYDYYHNEIYRIYTKRKDFKTYLGKFLCSGDVLYDLYTGHELLNLINLDIPDVLDIVNVKINGDVFLLVLA